MRPSLFPVPNNPLVSTFCRLKCFMQREAIDCHRDPGQPTEAPCSSITADGQAQTKGQQCVCIYSWSRDKVGDMTCSDSSVDASGCEREFYYGKSSKTPKNPSMLLKFLLSAGFSCCDYRANW